MIYAVADLHAAVETFRRRYGLVSVRGGVHPKGTANYSVALRNSQYIELLGVHDESAAMADPFGRSLVARIDQGDGLLAWAIRTDDLDEFATRVGVMPVIGSIVEEDGSVYTWRMVEAPDDANGALPFLISYDEDPAASAEAWDKEFEASGHPSGAITIAWVEVGVGKERLFEWIGHHDLPIRVAEGRGGLLGVCLSTPGDEIVIR